MAKICIKPITKEIDDLGETVTVRTVSQTLSDYGDATDSNSDETGVKAVMNDLSPEEVKDKEGIMIGADKRFFFKGTQSNLSNGNKIIYDSTTYEMVKVNKQTVKGTTFVIEVYGKIV